MSKIYPPNGGLFLCFLLLFSLPVFSFSSTLNDACYYNCTDGGEIGNEQTIIRGSAPAILTETKAPRCEPGEREYLWMYYSATSGGWKHIPNSNTKNYQPGELFRTTYFLRCVRKKGCTTFIESNILRVVAVDCMPSGIEHEEACMDDAVKFYAKTVYSTNDVKYQWIFEGGSPSTSASQHVDVIWSSEGLKKVTLTVIDGQCENTYEEEVYVINCDCKGFYCRVSSNADCGSGSARANGYGGAEPYSYRWDNGATSRRVSGLSVGGHSVTVTDANGCECVRYFDIAPEANVGCRIISSSDPSACGGDDGSAAAKGFGGSGRYIYTWSNGQRGAIATGLSADTYMVTVRDPVSGCSSTCSITLTDPSFTISTQVEAASCNIGHGGGTGSEEEFSRVALACTGSVSVEVNSGSTCAVYSYDWSNGQTTSTATGLCPDTKHTVSVTDLCTGCMTVSDEITVPGGPQIVMTETSAVTCDDNGGQWKATVSGGTPPYSYSAVSVGEGTIDVDGGMVSSVPGLQADTYGFFVTDANGCSAFNDITLIGPDDCCEEVAFDLLLSVASPDCGDGNGGIRISVSGGMQNVTYSWTDGTNTGTIFEDGNNQDDPVVNGLPAGTNFCVTMTPLGINGCPKEACIIAPSFDLDATFTETEIDCGEGTGRMDFILSIPGTYCFEITDGASSTTTTEGRFTGLDGGTEYEVTFSPRSGIGCIDACDRVFNFTTSPVGSGDLCCDDAFDFTLSEEPNCSGSSGRLRITLTNVDGDCNYSAEVQVPGQSSPIQIPNINDFIEVEVPYDAEVEVTVVSDCEETCEGLSKSFTIGTPPSNITVELDRECAGPTATITASASGGLGMPYTYSWFNQDNNMLLSTGTSNTVDVGPGNYTVAVSDGRACSEFALEQNFSVLPCEDFIDFRAIKLRDDGIGGLDFFNDERLSGWEFILYAENSIEIIDQGITQSDGIARFVVTAGTYVLCVTPQPGWITSPLNNLDPEDDPLALGRACIERTLIYSPGPSSSSSNIWSIETSSTDRLVTPTKGLNSDQEVTYQSVNQYTPTQDQTINPFTKGNSTTAVRSTTRIFPNPFQESVNILLGDSNSHLGLLNIQVMNVAGQVVQQQVIDSAFAKYELDLLNQPIGIYFIRISGEGMEPEVHKVVKK